MEHTITIAISLAISFIAVFTGVLMNNNRLNDVKELLHAEIKASQAELTSLLVSRFGELDARLIHIEDRLSRLESDRRVIS
jgi:hypothetical protein